MKWKEKDQPLLTPRRKLRWTRTLAWMLAIALLVPSRGPVFASDEAPPEDGICVHHPQHDETCGYSEPSEGTPCTHVHDENCGYSEPSEGTPCTHVHDESCGYAAGSEEVPCDKGCTETDEANNIIHQAGCAYTPAAAETPCTHAHDETCGYSEPSEGTPCTHVHDETCGYTEGTEGSPCGYVCGLCVTGWNWNDEPGLLDFSKDAKLWGLAFPGASAEDPVTRELLLELLPVTVTAATPAGERTAALDWDLSALPETGAYEGSYTLTAQLKDGFSLTENAPALEVLLVLGGGETYRDPVPNVKVPSPNENPTHKFVNNWKYVIPDGGINITEENYIYSATLALDLSQEKSKQIEAITAALPKQISCWGGNWGGGLVAAGFIPINEQSNGTIEGHVNITWNVADAIEKKSEVDGKTTLQLYAKPVSNTGYLIRVNTNDPNYKDDSGAADGFADTAEADDILNLTLTLEKIKTGYPGPVASVPVERDSNGNPLHKFVNNWEYVVPGDGYTITADEKNFGYSTTLAIPLSSTTNLVETITNALPQQIYCTGYNSDNTLVAAGFEFKENLDGGKVGGYVNLQWNVEDVIQEGQNLDGQSMTFYAQPVSNDGYLLRVNTNCADYKDSNNGEADTAEATDIINLTVTLTDVNLALRDHIVQPASPENVTVNLFDYWVRDYGENPAAPQGDILPKTDSHCYEDSTNNWAVTTYPTGYSASQDWYTGINQGHLLLFGDGLIHAGLWNKGAGENTRYGKAYAGMEGIVKNTLTNGYPELNLPMANKVLTDDDRRDESLIKDYMLAGDHNEQYGTDYNSDNIKNLSDTVVKLWTQNTGKTLAATESLDYLFTPESGSCKRYYGDVTGLFQLDNNGYYYYNMRKNFAEFSGAEGNNNGNNHFILYDAPATVRTDGVRSIGNFFPFNKGYEVFNSVNDDKLASSVPCSNNTMNHHLGMTVQVDFRQPAGGMINTGSKAQPMTFGFSGDDDVWVFIDDVLVLDMGGIHSEVYGTIDFSTGDVYIGRAFGVNGVPENPANSSIMVTHTNLHTLYANAEKADETKWNGDTFASNTSHTLKMFYLERGNYDSSIALRFNLQPLLYQQIKKVDQNGDPVAGVEFKLYEAAETSDTNAIECLYTDSSVGGGKTFYVSQTGTAPLVELATDENGLATFMTNDGYFNFADRGEQYYILKETKAPDGYRTQPIDIVLRYDPHTAMLSVANRWTTGAYACSTVHVTGQPSGSSGEANGLVAAVPLMEKKSNGSWLALYGSNLAGFQSVTAGSESDLLLAALYQAKSGAADWHLDWDGTNNRLTGKLSDLPGLASRYTLIDPDNGDMQMAYVLITAEGLAKLGITEGTPADRYQALQNYLKDHTPEEAQSAIGGGFQRLDTNTFNRDFRSLIYIPNERRELRVLKIDQDGKPLQGAEFTLYSDKSCLNPVVSGNTDSNGMLVFSPSSGSTEGHANMVWAGSANTQYYLKETMPPNGHALNNTVIPVVVGTYSIYADAGKPEDNVSVMAGVGRLTQTMRQYAMGGDVDITLQDITAAMQVQDSDSFSLTGWRDAKLDGTNVPRQMNLHYNKNNDGGNLVDYGLHDEDGGKVYKPFFVTDTGFIRTRIQQMAGDVIYDGVNRDANKDTLGTTDLTNLFSLLNVVVVKDQADTPAKETVQLTISKKLEGEKLTDADYARQYSFQVTLTDAAGETLSGSYEYHFYGKDKWGTISNNDTLYLRHGESVTILGLPEGTRFTVTETNIPAGWYVTPGPSISGTAGTDNAAFTNTTTKPPDQPEPPETVQLTISKTVEGENLTGADYAKSYHFQVALTDAAGNSLPDTFQYQYSDGGSGTISSGGALTLRHGQSVSIQNLPKGTRFTVTETDDLPEGWSVSPGKEISGTAGTDNAAFTNKAPKPAGKTVQLVISKKIEGENLTDADYARNYQFQVTLTGTDGKPLTGTFQYQYSSGGGGTIASGGVLILRHGQSAAIQGLPEGTKFTVTEIDLPAGWSVTPGPTMSGIAGVTDVEFVNIAPKPVVPPTDPEAPPTDPEDPPKDPEDPPKDPEDPPKDPEDPPKDPEDPPKDPEDPPKDPENPPEDPENPPEDPEDPPKDPENPPENPENPPEDPENPPEDPENPPEDPENPPENPETPPDDPAAPTEDSETPPEDSDTPEYPTELPDPNDPDSPDEITILENGVPTTYIKVWDPEEEEWVYIPEDEVPLTDTEPDSNESDESEVPATGDRSIVWLFTGGASLTGLAVIRKSKKKDEDEE